MGKRSAVVIACVTTFSSTAFADDDELSPPGETPPTSGDETLNIPPIEPASPLPSTAIPGIEKPAERDRGEWGAGARITGLSGIGALPGRNIGGEIAVLVRHDELFGELALGHWQPEETYIVAETPERVKLALDVWTLRGGWASRRMPLRAWLLAEAGELAGPDGMGNALPRMVMMNVPAERRWFALGGGVGVAWPMSDYARLFGSVELAIPVQRRELVMSEGRPYEPDIAAARCSLGLEVGWP